MVEDEEEKAVSTFSTCICSFKSQLTATSSPFVSKAKKKLVFLILHLFWEPLFARVILVLSLNLNLLFLIRLRHHLLDHRLWLLLCNMPIRLQHSLLSTWNAAPNDNARQALEQVALTHGTTAVRVEALLKRDERSQADMAALQASLNAAMAAVNAANANAQAAQAVAVAATASTFKPATPPRYENKDKDMEIRKWLPVVEDYARTCNDGDYLRTVSSFPHGKPRLYFQSKYDAYKAANGGAKPANPREFFCETMISGSGLSDQT
jgi:hypothetical protein